MTLFEELKRRQVFKVGAAYAVVGWLLIQIISDVAEPLRFPPWVAAFVIVSVGLGFPVALILAWVFELTPEGIRRTGATAAEAAQSGQKLNWITLGAVVVLLGMAAMDAMSPDVSAPDGNGATALAPETVAPASPAPLDAPEGSIAVLPFANLSGDATQEPFADGLTIQLIDQLTQVEGLQVTGQNSSFYYKGRNEALRDIGTQLGVRHVLQGSVQRSEQSLRISAQLLDVASNSNLWSETFDREMTDIFAIQDEIAKAVTTALSVTLRAGIFSAPGMTGNLQAYEYYLEARAMMQEVDAASAEQAQLNALDLLEKAVEADHEFGRAWGTLAVQYRNTWNLRPSDRQAFEASAERAAAKAQELFQEFVAADNPGALLFEALNALEARRFADVESNLERLLAQYPSNFGASQLSAQFLWSVGRPTDGLRHAQQVRRIEPKQFGFYLISILINLGRDDEAREEMERAGANGAGAEALAGFDLMLASSDEPAALAAYKAFPYGNTEFQSIVSAWDTQGTEAALTVLRQLVRGGDLTGAGSVVYRGFAAHLGDPQLALDLLRSSEVLPGDIWLPLYSEVRRLDGFKDWVREQGLLDYWLATGNWSEFCRPLPENENDFECF